MIEVNIWGDWQTSHPAGCFIVLRNPPNAPINFIPPAIFKRLSVMDARCNWCIWFQIDQCSSLCLIDH
jgi:hypothetical protein